jgi:8-oxo-dGTP pyrophosphatase MutT (NUDIX family)
MKVVNFNVDGIEEVDITKVVVRVKAFVINNNKIYIASSNGGCQLPGGHVEDGEDVTMALVRELREEMGIDIDNSDIKGPFFEINHYTKIADNNNKKSQVLYFVVNTTKQPDITKTKYTEHEKLYNFAIHQIPLAEAKQYIMSFITDAQQPINKVIAQEMLVALEELQIYLSQGDNNG